MQITEDFSRLSLGNSVRSLEALPLQTPYTSNQSEEISSKLMEAFTKHIGTLQELKDIRNLHYQRYSILKPSLLFTAEEARAIAKKVASIVVAKNNQNYFYSRKRSKLAWKVLFPSGEKAFLLLPKKNLFPDVDGYIKRGRVALLCKEEAGKWHSTILFALSAKTSKENPTAYIRNHFVNAREVENKLFARVGHNFFPTCYYDFNQKKDQDRRLCFYERLDCLYYFDKSGGMQQLLTLALSAAKKIASLHENEVVLCDLKSLNLLIKDGKEVLICDLDTVEFDTQIRQLKTVFTIDYLAPELKQKKESNAKSCDVFAFGCVLLDLFFDKAPPWDDKQVAHRMLDDDTMHEYAKMANNSADILKTEVSLKKCILCLVKWAFHPDANSRPTMKDIVDILSKPLVVHNDLADADLEAFVEFEKRRSKANSCTQKYGRMV